MWWHNISVAHDLLVILNEDIEGTTLIKKLKELRKYYNDNLKKRKKVKWLEKTQYTEEIRMKMNSIIMAEIDMFTARIGEIDAILKHEKLNNYINPKKEK